MYTYVYIIIYTYIYIYIYVSKYDAVPAYAAPSGVPECVSASGQHIVYVCMLYYSVLCYVVISSISISISSIHIYIYIYICTNTCIITSIMIYVCMYVCMYIYIYIHTYIGSIRHCVFPNPPRDETSRANSQWTMGTPQTTPTPSPKICQGLLHSLACSFVI